VDPIHRGNSAVPQPGRDALGGQWERKYANGAECEGGARGKPRACLTTSCKPAFCIGAKLGGMELHSFAMVRPLFLPGRSAQEGGVSLRGPLQELSGPAVPLVQDPPNGQGDRLSVALLFERNGRSRGSALTRGRGRGRFLGAR